MRTESEEQKSDYDETTDMVEMRKRRSLKEFEKYHNDEQSTYSSYGLEYANVSSNESENHLIELESYESAVVLGKNEIILTNLMHFQEYSIEVSRTFFNLINDIYACLA